MGHAALDLGDDRGLDLLRAPHGSHRRHRGGERRRCCWAPHEPRRTDPRRPGGAVRRRAPDLGDREAACAAGGGLRGHRGRALRPGRLPRAGGRGRRNAPRRALRHRAGAPHRLRARAARDAVRADRVVPVDRDDGLFDRLRPRQQGRPPDPLLRLLRGRARQHHRHRLRRQHVHALSLLRGADALHLPTCDSQRHRGGTARRQDLPRDPAVDVDPAAALRDPLDLGRGGDARLREGRNSRRRRERTHSRRAAGALHVRHRQGGAHAASTPGCRRRWWRRRR